MKKKINRNSSYPNFHSFKIYLNLPSIIKNCSSKIEKNATVLNEFENSKKLSSKGVLTKLYKKTSIKKRINLSNQNIKRENFQEERINRNINKKITKQPTMKKSKSVLDILKREDSEEFDLYMKQSKEFLSKKIKEDKNFLSKLKAIKRKVYINQKSYPLINNNPFFFHIGIIKANSLQHK